MGPSAAGHVVLVSFPFSDLTASKLRPAVVLAGAGRGDWILCQVSSNAYGDNRAVALGAVDFASGSLHRDSFARPGKLFTAHTSLFAKKAGELTREKLATVRDSVVQLILAE